LSSHAQTGTLRTSPSKLKVLEEKAGDRDWLAKRCKELESQLSEALSSWSNASQQADFLRPRGMRLEELERKAMAYDGFVATLDKRERMIAQMTNQLAQAQAESAARGDEIATLKTQILSLTNNVVRLEALGKSLRSTIEQLLIGSFEYYEVKDGDTIESIAALPTIYGDASRSEWIRQANWKRVEDVDRLRPRQMLIVPRFPPNGRYEF
jgi:DNA repair exonuclease SbcCD ATPase subunit